MTRIEAIRNAVSALPSVQRLGVLRRVDRHDPRDEEEEEPRRRPRQEAPEDEPPGPDADGHIDVSV